MSRDPIAAVKLQPSESEVLAAASRFFAAHIAAGTVGPESETEIMEMCIAQAIKMALRVDRLLESDSEVSGLSRRGPA